MSEVIYGVRPIIEALRAGRREILEVLDSTGNKEIRQAASGYGVPVRKAPRPKIDELANGGIHQGIAARVGAYPYTDLNDILTVPKPLIVVLDGITDPRNLGAILRVADAAGATGVVIPKDRAATVTPVAVKSSAGASEHIPVARETNVRRAIDRMKKARVWVYAAEADGTPHTKHDLAGSVALVLGSEGKGIRRLVREGCDGAVSVPMFGAVGSLNVSVAAAVLLYEARRQRGE